MAGFSGFFMQDFPRLFLYCGGHKSGSVREFIFPDSLPAKPRQA
jgi:hypothetical protein